MADKAISLDGVKLVAQCIKEYADSRLNEVNIEMNEISNKLGLETDETLESKIKKYVDNRLNNLLTDTELEDIYENAGI